MLDSRRSLCSSPGGWLRLFFLELIVLIQGADALIVPEGMTLIYILAAPLKISAKRSTSLGVPLVQMMNRIGSKIGSPRITMGTNRGKPGAAPPARTVSTVPPLQSRREAASEPDF